MKTETSNFTPLFKEKGDNRFYLEDGIWVKCDESKIESLWYDWIMLPDAEHRQDEEGFTVFGQINPEIMKNKIVEIAESYIGQEEKIKNSGFKNSWFEKLMRGVGFYTGAPWCAFFAKLVWKEAGVDHSLISGSVRQTMLNATKAGNWHTYPVEGAIVVWMTFKNGKPKRTGHVGILVGPQQLMVTNSFIYKTIEGNTNKSGSREGTDVLLKVRATNWTETDGLRLMGFIHPKYLHNSK